MSSITQGSALAPRPLPPLQARRAPLRVLLIQVRDHFPALAHEQLCFLERLGLVPDELVSVNVVEQAVPTWSEAKAADLVVLGGAGSHSAYRDYPFTAPLMELVRRVVDGGRPLFGSCFGHQLLARALGGVVESNPAAAEVGTFDVELTDAGAVDPLFAGAPRRFPVHLGHHDQVRELPPGLISLASSELCRHQVLRAPGRPVYATQFHCELSIEAMRQRLFMYRDGYLRDGEDPAEVESRFRPTRQADGLLQRFIELYL